MGRLIHPMAQIDADVELGEGVRVWQFASVIRKAWLGDGCNVASCAIVDGAVLGAGCLVGHGASVHPGCLAQDKVFIGPGAVICNDRWPRADKEGFDVRALLDHELIGVRLEEGCSIGANAVVLPGVRIGRGAMVAAGAVVSAEVPPGFLWTRLGDLVSIRETHGPRMRAAPC